MAGERNDPSATKRRIDYLAQMAIDYRGHSQKAEVSPDWLARVRAAIQVGIDQADRGETILIDDIDQWFDRLEAEIDAES